MTALTLDKDAIYQDAPDTSSRFVVLDARSREINLSAAKQLIADRRLGIGCDQLITLRSAARSQTDVFFGSTIRTAARLAPAAIHDPTSPRSDRRKGGRSCSRRTYQPARRRTPARDSVDMGPVRVGLAGDSRSALPTTLCASRSVWDR